MAFLTVTELKAHMLNGIVDVISEGDDTKVQEAIDAAIAEAGSYLSNYDTEAIYALTGAARNPILLMYIKDIAIWHFIQLANANVDMEVRLRRYEFAIKWFAKVQRGEATPTLAPLVAADEQQVGKLRYGSNTKRITGY